MNIISFDPKIMWHDDLFIRKPCREISKEEVISEQFQQIVHFMLLSLYENPIGVGLAAPQIGLQIRLAVIDIRRDGKNPIVLINPTYTSVDNETVESVETCLSFPCLSGTVKRYSKVIVSAKNLAFEDVHFEANSFLSIVCQHEIDHLNGIVYIDKAQKLGAAENRSKLLADRALRAIENK